MWMLARLGESGPVGKPDLMAQLHIGEAQCTALLDALCAAGFAHLRPDGIYALSRDGQAAFQRLLHQREADLQTLLADWRPEEHPEVEAMMRNLANSFKLSPPVRA
jgi:DNA-binding MarR family transcriptional regulator